MVDTIDDDDDDDDDDDIDEDMWDYRKFFLDFFYLIFGRFFRDTCTTEPLGLVKKYVYIVLL